MAGRTGAFDFRSVARASAATDRMGGTLTIVGGTGGLANLRGHGTFEGSISEDHGTITWQLHWDPR